MPNFVETARSISAELRVNHIEFHFITLIYQLSKCKLRKHDEVFDGRMQIIRIGHCSFQRKWKEKLNPNTNSSDFIFIANDYFCNPIQFMYFVYRLLFFQVAIAYVWETVYSLLIEYASVIFVTESNFIISIQGEPKKTYQSIHLGITAWCFAVAQKDFTFKVNKLSSSASELCKLPLNNSTRKLS